MGTLRTSAVLLVIGLSLAASACGGAEANSSSGSEGTQPAVQERQEGGDDRQANTEDGSRDRSRGGESRGRGEREIESAILELSGDEGTAYAGVCKIGREETEVEGTVPETMELDLNGEPLECKIANTGSGSLKADLAVGNAHYVQQTSVRGATLNFALSGEGYSSSTSSVTAVETETPDAVSNASSNVEAGPGDEE